MMEKRIDKLKDEDHKALALWAADCAEHVLAYFEQTRPEDKRPRRAVEAARAWVRGDLNMTEARKAAFASHAAAREVENPAAQAAARAAGHAAATAHLADHAAHAATYALKAANAAAEYTGDAMIAEREWQYERLPEHLRPVVYSTSKHNPPKW